MGDIVLATVATCACADTVDSLQLCINGKYLSAKAPHINGGIWLSPIYLLLTVQLVTVHTQNVMKST